MEKLIKNYKNHKIVSTNGVIEVVSQSNTRFVIGLDDSKDCGYKKFDESSNNVKSARDYIDWNCQFTERN